MSIDSQNDALSLAGERIIFQGKLAGMPRREACRLVTERGGAALETFDQQPTMIVVGEQGLPLEHVHRDGGLFDEPTRAAIDAGEITVVRESEFWQRLGLVDQPQHSQQLYTPAMLAELLGVPLAIVRRWHRRGLIVPAREVRKLPYFDFNEIATARRLAELLAAGMTAAQIERQLADLARLTPGVERPLAQLSTIVKGRHLLLRQGDGLIAPGGQLWFDFEHETSDSPLDQFDTPHVLSLAAINDSNHDLPTPEELFRHAGELEDEGDLTAAADMYRAALAAGGPNATVCFLLAELLYRMGDLPAARERYYMTLELNEEHVEARANLGCVLAEQGHHELAVSAFTGALALHPEYADVHYHLARTLDDLDRPLEADEHWRQFLNLAPESPWAAQARRRLRKH